ncbi:hypothetical protein INR49_020454 [Caranx melampygus]|nr:hypothetical protein INR49_020454 [Caranx melampygus]
MCSSTVNSEKSPTLSRHWGDVLSPSQARGGRGQPAVCVTCHLTSRCSNVFQVGDRDDSNLYISTKRRPLPRSELMRNTCGYQAQLRRTRSVLQNIRGVNENVSVHGLIVQLPLDSVNPIDTSWSPTLCLQRRTWTGVSVGGKTCVVIGRSKLSALRCTTCCCGTTPL